MTDQPRALDTGRYVTNGSTEAHNALVSRLVSAKRQPLPHARINAPETAHDFTIAALISNRRSSP